MNGKNISFDPTRDDCDRIVLTEEMVEKYSLDSWAKDFTLMTAGYRDTLDENDVNNPEAPFNSITLAICIEAKARVFSRQLKDNETVHIHIGGEVRPHTQTLIRLSSRIYTAHNIVVHLRKELNTTPIWYSSFGIAYLEYNSGDNFTASHSPYFKGGWKPLDSEGKQLLGEEEAIIEEVKNIVKNRQTIHLRPWEGNDFIKNDFDIDDAYITYQNYVFGEDLISEITSAGEKGFRCLICPVGGSMKATSKRLFNKFGLSVDENEDSIINYFYGEEDKHFHRIGIYEDNNYGVDPGKSEIYRNIGAQEKLLSGLADLLIIWDPDGDRIKIATKIPLDERNVAEKVGIEVDDVASEKECVIYFTPNQLYMMVTAYRIEMLKKSGGINEYDWFIGCSYPTTKSLEELANAFSLKIARVPVGFKHIGELCRQIEEQLGDETIKYISDTSGVTTELGAKPRSIILCEESGGANLGGSELLVSKNGKKKMLAIREKDGMQIGLMTISLASYVFNKQLSLCKYYFDIIKDNGITRLHYDRHDIKLYDEDLLGAELKKAKDEGIKKRDQVVNFFKTLVELYEKKDRTLEEITQIINDSRRGGDIAMPPILNAFWIGDGSLFETSDFQFILRASGTDAVLRYYLDGKDKRINSNIAEMLMNLDYQ